MEFFKTLNGVARRHVYGDYLLHRAIEDLEKDILSIERKLDFYTRILGICDPNRDRARIRRISARLTVLEKRGLYILDKLDTLSLRLKESIRRN